MDEQKTASAIESALGAAFGSAPPPPKPAPAAAPAAEPAASIPAPEAAAPEAPAAPAPQVPDDEQTELERLADEIENEGKPRTDTRAVNEPEFVITVDGREERVRGQDRVTELLQKGFHYTRNSEEVARQREHLAAQTQMMETAARFQQEVIGDIAELKQMDEQLAQYDKVDWSSAIDMDLGGAMKLQQQRALLKEQRDAKWRSLEQRGANFAAGQAEAARKVQQAEVAALLAKLPEWRDSATGSKERNAMIRTMQDFGYQPAEISAVMDHRFVAMVATLQRDAQKWRELQKAKQERVKQVREAPPVITPGAASSQTGADSRAGFQQFQREFRKQGRQGHHRAQEAALQKVLSRTFK